MKKLETGRKDITNPEDYWGKNKYIYSRLAPSGFKTTLTPKAPGTTILNTFTAHIYILLRAKDAIESITFT